MDHPVEELEGGGEDAQPVVEELDQEVEEDHQQGDAVVDEVGRAGQLRLRENLSQDDGKLEGEQRRQQENSGEYCVTPPSWNSLHSPAFFRKLLETLNKIDHSDQSRQQNQDSAGETLGDVRVVSLPDLREVEQGPVSSADVLQHSLGVHGSVTAAKLDWSLFWC